MNQELISLRRRIAKYNAMYNTLNAVNNALNSDLFIANASEKLEDEYDLVTSSYKNNAQIPSKDNFMKLKVSINDRYVTEVKNRVSNEMRRISKLRQELIDELEELCEEW